MKISYKTPIALAVAAFFTSPLALAADAQSGGVQVGGAHLTVDIDNDNDAYLEGEVLEHASGNIGVNAAAGNYNQQANGAAIATDTSTLTGSADAATNRTQVTILSGSLSVDSDNDAYMTDEVLEDASGNIGVNVAAGNANQQANDLAIAIHDESSGSFADADALVGYNQVMFLTGSLSEDSDNEAYLDDQVLRDAEGNIGVNVAAGNGNQQGNGTAIATSKTSGTANADVAYAFQASLGNLGLADDSDNEAYLDDEVLRDAEGNIGVNVAAGNGNQQGNGLAIATVTDGGLASASAGSAQVSALGIQEGVSVDNTVSLSYQVLQNASGNIGVNVAAGNANQQTNSLAIASAK